MHDNKGRIKGLALGAELVGRTLFLHSHLHMHTHMHINPLTKLNNRHSMQAHTKTRVYKFQFIGIMKNEAATERNPHKPLCTVVNS